MAMPPRMLPVAMSKLCWTAAALTIAISGRLVATANRISPPSASPSPKRESISSVVLESWMPANQMAHAEAMNTPPRTGKLRWLITRTAVRRRHLAVTVQPLRRYCRFLEPSFHAFA